MTDLTRIQFVVPGAAAPQGSKRHLGSGVMIESSKRVKPWRVDVRTSAGLCITGDPWSGPVRLVADFFYRRGPSHFLTDGVSLSAAGRRAPYPGRRGDVDKLLRAVLDACTGVVFHDDDQVVSVAGGKQWGTRDEARISVWRIADEMAEAA